jgi:hypothetical protein
LKRGVSECIDFISAARLARRARLSAVSSKSADATVGRAALARQSLHDHGVLERGLADHDGIAHAQRLRGLGALLVHRDVAGGDRLRRDRARLEEARRPQPFV